jgi:O-methyltransferase
MDVPALTVRLGKTVGKRIMPRTFRDAVKRALHTPDDIHFRICSPATAPELAHCLYDLHRDGRLEGGAYYEFGIFRGYALWFAQEMTKRLGVKDFHCYGFDSFQGLPAPQGVGDEGSPWQPGEFAVSKAQVEDNLRSFDADFSRISLHEGFFSDELFASFGRTVFFRPAQLVLVDCDLYSSTVPVLKFIRQHIVDGTIVLFDDYNCFHGADDRGQRRALAEFLGEHPDVLAEPLRAFGWHGQGFKFRVRA